MARTRNSTNVQPCSGDSAGPCPTPRADANSGKPRSRAWRLQRPDELERRKREPGSRSR